MERPYLLLWFAIAFFGIIAVWGLLGRLGGPPDPPPRAPATGESILERIQQRQRELRPPATTQVLPRN